MRKSEYEWVSTNWEYIPIQMQTVLNSLPYERMERQCFTKHEYPKDLMVIEKGIDIMGSEVKIGMRSANYRSYTYKILDGKGRIAKRIRGINYLDFQQKVFKLYEEERR